MATEGKFSFKEWLVGITSAFSSGRKVVVDGGGIVKGQGKPAPPEALLARKRLADSQPEPGWLSRMEEARRKNMVWNNQIGTLLDERLRDAFHPENYARLRLTPSRWTNLLRRVVEDISILYETPARRSIVEDQKTKQTDGSDPEQPTTDPMGDPAAEDAEATDKPKEAPQKECPECGTMNSPQMPVCKVCGKPLPEMTSEDMPEGSMPPGHEKIGTGDPDIDALAAVLELEGADEKKETPLDKVMKLADLDVVLDLVEKKCRFQEAVWVRPYVRYESNIPLEEGQDPETTERKGDPATAKLEYLIYDPETADVIEDPTNPMRALAWYYFADELQPDGSTRKVCHFFTADFYWKFDQDWRTMYSEANPLKRLPVTAFRKERPSNGYYVKGCGRDLYEATLEFCLLRTIQNQRYKDAGFKQMVIEGASPDDISADQVMGGPTPIFVPQEGSATVLDLSPDLMPMTEMVGGRGLEVAAMHGITGASWKAEGSPQSGFAKKLDRDKILKENRRIRKQFAESERDLYNNLATTLEVYPIKGVPKLKPDAKFETDFGEPSFEEDPRHQNTIDAQAMKLNMTSIVDVLKRENPDLSEVELVKLAYRNKRINEAFIPKATSDLLDLMATGAQVGGSYGSLRPGEAPPGGGDSGGDQPDKKPGFGGGGKPPFGK